MFVKMLNFNTKVNNYGKSCLSLCASLYHLKRFVLACDACRVETHGHGHGVRTVLTMVDGRDSQVHRVSKNNMTGVQGLISG